MGNKESLGLTERTLNTITSILERYTSITNALVFGSRAKGTYKEGSDIDLCIKTDEAFSHDDFIRLSGDFEESSLPYFFDIVQYNKITNQNLLEHINQVAVEIFERKK